jgi:hypothetical protein
VCRPTAGGRSPVVGRARRRLEAGPGGQWWPCRCRRQVPQMVPFGKRKLDAARPVRSVSASQGAGGRGSAERAGDVSCANGTPRMERRSQIPASSSARSCRRFKQCRSPLLSMRQGSRTVTCRRSATGRKHRTRGTGQPYSVPRSLLKSAVRRIEIEIIFFSLERLSQAAGPFFLPASSTNRRSTSAAGGSGSCSCV